MVLRYSGRVGRRRFLSKRGMISPQVKERVSNRHRDSLLFCFFCFCSFCFCSFCFCFSFSFFFSPPLFLLFSFSQTLPFLSPVPHSFCFLSLLSFLTLLFLALFFTHTFSLHISTWRWQGNNAFLDHLERGDGIFLPISWAILVLVIFLHTLFFRLSLFLSPPPPSTKALLQGEDEEWWKSRDWGACEIEENTECAEEEGGSDRM